MNIYLINTIRALSVYCVLAVVGQAQAIETAKPYTFGIVPQQSASKLAEEWGTLISEISKRSGMHKATQNGQVQVGTLLLNKGAHRNVQMKDGCTPLDFAERSGRYAIVSLLNQS
jgi:hypothetical protein